MDVGNNAVKIGAPGKADSVGKESVVFTGQQRFEFVVLNHLCTTLKFNYYV